MMMEKLKKKMVPGITTVTELCCFLEICFLLFFFYWSVLDVYNFVQMTAEPGKAVAAIDA